MEEDDGSADRQKHPALLTSRYLLKFEEEEILYLSASLAAVEEELEQWGRGGVRVRPRLVTIGFLPRRVVRRLVGQVLQFQE